MIYWTSLPPLFSNVFCLLNKIYHCCCYCTLVAAHKSESSGDMMPHILSRLRILNSFIFWQLWEQFEKLETSAKLSLFWYGNNENNLVLTFPVTQIKYFKCFTTSSAPSLFFFFCSHSLIFADVHTYKR